VGDGLLEEATLVLARRLLRRGDVVRRERQLRAALHLTNGDVGVRQEDVELVHEVLGNELRHVHDVQRVAEHGQVDLVTQEEQVLEGLLVDLHEDDFLVDVGLINVDLLSFGGLADAEAQQHLLLDRVGGWRLKLELEGLSTGGDREEEEAVAERLEELLEGFLDLVALLHGLDLLVGGLAHAQVQQRLLEQVVSRRERCTSE